MGNKTSLFLVRLLTLAAIVILIWYLFSQNNEVTHTQPISAEPEAHNQLEPLKKETSEFKPSTAPESDEDQTILQTTSPIMLESDIPSGDLGGIDNIPTPEMIEAMQAFAPEAGDDGVIGPAPEDGDDGSAGDPPEAGDTGFIGEPPEGYDSEGIGDEVLYLEGPGGPEVTE